MSAPLIILLHGVGASGASLAPLAEAMAPALPGVAFATPDGVEPFDMGGPGRQWFSVKGVTAENRPARVAAARPAFDAALDRIIAEHGARPEHVALLGFSQGTIMSLDLLADGRRGFGALVGFSGRLPTPDPLHPAPNMPALLIHGDADPVIPASDTLDAARRLQAAGVSVETHIQPGLGHSISAEGLQLAVDFLRNRLL